MAVGDICDKAEKGERGEKSDKGERDKSKMTRAPEKASPGVSKQLVLTDNPKAKVLAQVQEITRECPQSIPQNLEFADIFPCLCGSSWNILART